MKQAAAASILLVITCLRETEQVTRRMKEAGTMSWTTYLETARNSGQIDGEINGQIVD